MEETIIHLASKRNLKKFFIILLISLLFLFTSILTLKENPIVAVVTILVFGFCLYLGVQRYLLLHGLSNIYISTEGIKTEFSPYNKEIFIPWGEITDVWLRSLTAGRTTNTTLYLSLKNPSLFSHSKKIEAYGNILKMIASPLVPSQRVERLQNAFQPRKYDLCIGDDYEMPIEQIALLIKSRISKEIPAGINQ